MYPFPAAYTGGMAQVHQIVAAFERFAPWRLAFEWDRVGLQLGDPQAEVGRAVVALDRSLGAARHAIERGAQLLVTHHPLIWEPMRRVRADDHAGRTLLELAQGGIAHIAAHTNWDGAEGGVSDVMARKLGLADVRKTGMARPVDSFKLVTFLPASDVERMIDALSVAGAGVIGAYERCAFLATGTGTFLGGEGAHPVVGQAGRIEHAPETRIEMLVPSERVEAVRQALLIAHPYEAPAYDFLARRAEAGQGSVRVGRLPNPMTLRELVARIDAAVGTRSWAWGNGDATVERVAVAGGAADKDWSAAQAAGAQVYVTGEVRHETALEASEMGLMMVAAGHFATENPACTDLRDLLASCVPDVDWSLYEPPAGLHGRPL